jgi:hypothetical protein
VRQLMAGEGPGQDVGEIEHAQAAKGCWSRRRRLRLLRLRAGRSSVWGQGLILWMWRGVACGGTAGVWFDPLRHQF